MNTSREEPLGPVLPSSAENRKTKGSLTTHSLIGPPFPSLILSTAVLFSYGQLLRERRGSQPVVLSPIDALSCCGPLKDLLRWSQHRKQHQRDTEHLTSKDTQARSLLFFQSCKERTRALSGPYTGRQQVSKVDLWWNGGRGVVKEL